MPSRYKQPPTAYDKRLAYPTENAPTFIDPRPAINQQPEDIWAAIAAASAHLPEVKKAIRVIDEALSNPDPSYAPTTATYRPATPDTALLKALHNGTLVEPHPKRTASATAHGRVPTIQTHNPSITASPMDTRDPHHRGVGWPSLGAIPQTNQPPSHQLTKPEPTPSTLWVSRCKPPTPWWQPGPYIGKTHNA
jgi:hypothetical protein